MTVSAPIRRIAILRALALGDMLCAVPALRSIRGVYPDAHITLIGLPWAREFAARFGHLVDEHVEFPGFPCIPEVALEPRRTIRFLDEMQDRRFDLAIQLQGNGLWSNAFMALLGARTTAGFLPPGLTQPPVSGTWIPYPPHGHEIRRLLRLSTALGGPDDEELELSVDDADRAELAALAAAARLEADGYAVVHPGASDPNRRWTIEGFAAAADALDDAGLQVVLTGSTSEAALSRAVAVRMRSDAIDLCGQTSLGALGALVDGARLVVTNDTGVSHIAAARRVPSVVVFSGSDPERWAPLDRSLHVAVGAGADSDRCHHSLSDGPDGPDAAASVHRCLGDACSLAARRADARDLPSPSLATRVEVGAVLAAVATQLERTDRTAA